MFILLFLEVLKIVFNALVFNEAATGYPSLACAIVFIC